MAGRGQVRFRLGFDRDLPKEVGSARMQLGSSLGADRGAAQGQARGRSVSGRGSGWGQLGGSLGGSSWADGGSSGLLGGSLLLWKPGSHFDAETYKKCSQAKMEKVRYVFSCQRFAVQAPTPAAFITSTEIVLVWAFFKNLEASGIGGSLQPR